jgi:hypothetical protein
MRPIALVLTLAVTIVCAPLAAAQQAGKVFGSVFSATSA